MERSQRRELLAGNGFRKLHLFELADVAGEDVGQCLIIGESDGRAISEQPVAFDEMLEAPAAARQKDLAAAIGSASVASPEPSPPANHLSIATASTPDESVLDDQLRERTVAHIKRLFSEVVKLNPSDIDSESTFDKYGVDSLMSLGIVRRFETDFGKLRATLLFEYPTVDALTDYFLEGYREALAKRFGVVEERSKQQFTPAGRAAAPTTTLDTLGAVQAEVELQTSVSARSPEVETLRAQSVAHEPSQLKTENVLRSRASVFEDEAIAIIGVAGRYPMADTLEELWDNLKSGRNCVTEIPPARWDAEAHYRSDSDASERSHSKWGGFINDVDKFDALFFNISPKDAQSMDPQERLFLETAWHAIEAAGYTRRRLDGVQNRHAGGIGVFVGCMYQQYPFVTSNHAAGALLSSSSYWSIANRVSHFFNFNGPSLAVDSACSSSLSALHLACAGIKRGECIMAVAGGVNLNLHPSKYLRLQQQGMLASTAQSKSLGDGDGLVPGEGVGAVLLKPLSLAIRDRESSTVSSRAQWSITAVGRAGLAYRIRKCKRT